MTLLPVQQQAWFLGLQLLPAACLGGLWQWDRRRRYLEQHPEVVLRRRARRDLRRQRRVLHRAARQGDARTFAAAAVSAMRAACAPHYPAEPRALVGRDILHVFAGNNGQEESLRPVVQRFFAVTDQAQFSAASADVAPLLQLHSQLEQVLQKLEAKL
jgi:hypothetical protein